MTEQLIEALANLSHLRPRYPHPASSIGTYIGPIYDANHCWEAKGPARDAFLELVPRIISHLENCCEAIPSSDRVTFSIYMVGKSPKTAGPTFMFISEDVSHRKRVRQLVKESGILKRYPGIKTAHIARDPGVDKLEQLATSQEPESTVFYDKPATEVFYDTSKPILTFGMPLFIQHNDGCAPSMRTATASIVHLGGRLFFLTVFHAFGKNTAPSNTSADTRDDEFEIDSDTDEEYDDEVNVAITSIGSRSPDTWSEYSMSDDDISDGQSDRSFSFSDAPTPVVEFPDSLETGSGFRDLLAVNESLLPFKMESEIHHLRRAEPPKPSLSSLAPLGTLAVWSMAKDWALVEITNDSVLASITTSDGSADDVARTCLKKIAKGPKGDAGILTRTASGGEMTGILSGTPSYTRLPYCTLFQEVYTVRLDGPLANGDCGSAIVDAATGELYGHIVAGCQRTGIAYIMAAHQVFQDLEELLDNEILLRESCLMGAGPLITAKEKLRVEVTTADNASTDIPRKRGIVPPERKIKPTCQRVDDTSYVPRQNTSEIWYGGLRDFDLDRLRYYLSTLSTPPAEKADKRSASILYHSAQPLTNEETYGSADHLSALWMTYLSENFFHRLESWQLPMFAIIEFLLMEVENWKRRVYQTSSRLLQITDYSPPFTRNFEDQVGEEKMPWQLHSIDNPLARTSLERLDQEAREFARHVTLPGLDDELFVEAARIARDYRNWDTVKCLTDQEKEALRQERLLGFWRQPKTRLIMIAITCIAAIVQGWTQTGGSVANQSWPAEFGLTDLGAGDIAKDKPTWIFAYVNAATRLGGSLFGCWLSARLQSRISGCRGAILISACLCMASTISASFAHSWQQLFWCGVMLGSGIGIVASVARIYGAEVSPSHLRGALEMNWPLFDALGTLLGFTASLIVSKIGPLSWRFQMASGSLPAICLLTLIYIVPEPPHRLLEQGRLPEAFAALLALRQTRLQAAIELFYINAQIQTEIDMLSQKSSDTGEAGELVQHAWRRAAVDNTGFYQCQSHVKSTNYLIRFGQLIRDKRMRRAIVASLVVMMSQQLCGINILSFYSSILFRDGNRDTIDAVWLRWGISLANFLFALHAGNFMDIRGWRFLLLTAYLGMQPLIFAACLSPSISMWSRAGIPVSSFFIFVFTFFYSECPGPVTVAYSSRIFPLLNREACMSLAVSISMFVAGLLTLFVPQLTQNLAYGHDNYEAGQYSLLAILISFKILGLLPLFFSITETAHFSLETLIYIFNVPMFQLIPYKLWHALQWVPSILGWTVSHYILRKEVEKPRD